MKRIEITKIQKHFIKCAIDLKNSVIDFEYEDFQLIHGCTKEEMSEELNDLRENLK